MDRHGWILQFFIESKLFQLVVEEEENFFSLKIFEQGKYFMQSVFMDKNAAHWLMHSLEHIVIGVNPKHFFTLREGDVAYTLQRGSNSFGQYLSVTELKVGGMRRSIIIPASKVQQGWRAMGLNKGECWNLLIMHWVVQNFYHTNLSSFQRFILLGPLLKR